MILTDPVAERVGVTEELTLDVGLVVCNRLATNGDAINVLVVEKLSCGIETFWEEIIGFPVGIEHIEENPILELTKRLHIEAIYNKD